MSLISQEKLKKLLSSFDKTKTFEKIEQEKDFGSLVGVVYLLAQTIQDFSAIKGDKGDKGDTATVEKIVETIIEKQPIVTNEIKEVAVADTPEVIKEKLESLEDEDKLKISAIKNLEGELEKLRKMKMGGQVIYSGGGGGGGRIVKSYDLSAELNGSTRIFNVPAMWRPISIHLSSFPNILRETIDFTWTPSTITLTSEVSDIAISTGQTLILVYAEA